MRAIELVARGASFANYFHSGTEIWTCNVTQFVFDGSTQGLKSSRHFWMDDIFYLGQLKPGLKQKLIDDGRPFYTIDEHPEYPTAIRYPLEEIIEKLYGLGIRPIRRGDNKLLHTNHTIPYMIMMAIVEQPDEIHMHGQDYIGRYSWENTQRACTEYWLGVAAGVGIEVKINPFSSLCDVNPVIGGNPHEPPPPYPLNGMYGFVQTPDLKRYGEW